MKTFDYSRFIERYLANEMSEEEKLWFTGELEGNEDLKKEVQLRRKADSVLRRQDLIRLREKLALIEKNRSESKLRFGSLKRISVSVAAAAVILFVAGVIALFSGRELSDDEIIERYYKTYELVTPSRTGLPATNNYYNQAIEYYKAHDFMNAAVYFKKVLEQEPENMHSALLNGVSNFEIENYPEANRSFTRVIDDHNNLYIDHAQWYLALCYIKTDEHKKAEKSLLAIKKSDSIYSRDASRILRVLKRN